MNQGYEGKITGVIGEEGLRNPNEFLIWRGITAEEMKNSNAGQLALEGFASSGGESRAHGFGWAGMSMSESQISQDHRIDSSVHGLLLTCALIAALPCLLAATTASTVLTRRRQAVLSRMIAAGLAQHTARIVAATEVGLSSILGWLLGVGSASLIAPVLNRLLPPEAQWFDSDFHVVTWQVGVVALLTTVVTIVSSIRKPASSRIHLSGLCIWLLGVALMVGATMFRWELRAATLFLGLLGLGLSVLSFRSALTYLVAKVSLVLRRGNVSMLMGASRLHAEAREASRGPASIGLAVLAAALTAALTGQLISYQSGEGVLGRDPSTLVATQTTHIQEISALGEDPLHIAIDRQGDIYVPSCKKFVEYTRIQVECTGTITTLHNSPEAQEINYPLGSPSLVDQIALKYGRIVESNTPNSTSNHNDMATLPETAYRAGMAQYVLWKQEQEGLIEAINQVDPLAPIYSPSLMRAARTYSADQVASLYKVASWWTVITCTIFALLAAVSTASHRKSLVAALGLVGLDAWTQRKAWLIYTLIPLALSLFLGTIIGIVANTCMTLILDISTRLPLDILLQPLFIALGIVIILGGTYTLISMRAVSDRPEVSDLEKD